MITREMCFPKGTDQGTLQIQVLGSLKRGVLGWINPTSWTWRVTSYTLMTTHICGLKLRDYEDKELENVVSKPTDAANSVCDKGKKVMNR